MSSWEERMAARTAERAANRGDEELADATGEALRPGHEDHHGHVRSNYFICSCGDPQTVGVFTVSVDSRYWSDDAAERIQAEREELDFQAWIECFICGEKGLMSDQVFGVWPPRTLSSLAV